MLMKDFVWRFSALLMAMTMISEISIAAYFDRDCFEESEMYGWDAKGFAEDPVSDGEYIYDRNLMDEATRAHSLRICYADEVIESIQLRVENDWTKDWLNTIGNADYSDRDNCKVYRPPRN